MTVANSPSRARSLVGRVRVPGGTDSRRPRAAPAMIRVTPAPGPFVVVVATPTKECGRCHNDHICGGRMRARGGSGGAEGTGRTGVMPRVRPEWPDGRGPAGRQGTGPE